MRKASDLDIKERERIAISTVAAKGPASSSSSAAAVSAPATSATLTVERPAATTVTQEVPSTSYGTPVDRAPRRSKAAIRRSRGLESSMEIEEGLRNFWYPAEFSAVSSGRCQVSVAGLAAHLGREIAGTMLARV